MTADLWSAGRSPMPASAAGHGTATPSDRAQDGRGHWAGLCQAAPRGCVCGRLLRPRPALASVPSFVQLGRGSSWPSLVPLAGMC